VETNGAAGVRYTKPLKTAGGGIGLLEVGERCEED